MVSGRRCPVARELVGEPRRCAAASCVSVSCRAVGSPTGSRSDRRTRSPCHFKTAPSTMSGHTSELIVAWRLRGCELGFGVGIAWGYSRSSANPARRSPMPRLCSWSNGHRSRWLGLSGSTPAARGIINPLHYRPISVITLNRRLDVGHPSALAFHHRLFVDPDVFHTKIVDSAVDHHRPTLYLRLPTIREPIVKDDRPCTVLGQFPFNLPHQVLAFFFAAFHGLLVKHLFELGIAIAGVVACGTAGVIFIKLLVGIVDAAAGQVEANFVVLAVHLWVP